MTLTPVWRVGALELTTSPYLVRFGADHGAPENVADILRSLLTDGDIEVSSHTGNRTLTLPILIENASLAVLADAEAALVAECDKPRNELYVDPGDGFAAPMVFDVFRGQLTFNRDDNYEMAGYRSYTLTFRALPYVRSATEVVTAALAASGSTTTLVDNMSATTNWTGTVNGGAVSPATAGGALSVTSTSLTGSVTITMTRTASITTSSTKYLVLDWKVSAGTKADAATTTLLTAAGDGVALTEVASGPSPTAGYTRTTFYVAAASVAVLTLTSVTAGLDKGVSVVRSLTLDNLDRSDVRPSLGSARQQIRTIAISGSAPTTGSIAVEHATNMLGDVVFYSYPNDAAHQTYAPANRNNRVSGPGPTVDASAVSGFHDVIDTATTYDVPVGATPDGDYLVMIRAARATSGAVASLTWTYEPRLSATAMATAVSNVYTGTFAATTADRLHRLGMVHLPLWDMAPGPTAVSRFTFVATNPGTDDLQLDEFYLFNLTTGRLTQVACGTGTAPTSSNRLWVDSPSIENDGLGRLLRGAAADRSDAFSAYPAALAVGVHEFKPPGVKTLVVTSNTADASVSFRYYPAAHSHSAT